MIPDFIDLRLWFKYKWHELKLLLTPKAKRRYKVSVLSFYGRRVSITADSDVGLFCDAAGTFSQRDAEFIAYRIARGPLVRKYGYDVFVTRSK